MPLHALSLVVFGLSLAHAQELTGAASEASGAEAPAVQEPGGEEPAPQAVAPAPVGPALAPAAEPVVPSVVSPALTAERLALLRSYKSRRLSVRNETELRGGGSSVGFTSPGYGPAVVMSDPIYTIRTWGIYEGSQRLDTVTALDRLQRDALKTQTVDDIRKARRRSRAWFTAAGLGGAAILGGIIGVRTADTRLEQIYFSQVTTGGTLLGITGLVVGSFPSSKANRLERYPAAVMSPEEAREAAGAHNESLRQELGLTPQEVWLMEMGSDE